MSTDDEIQLAAIASKEPIELARLNAKQRHIRLRIVSTHEAGHATMGVLFDIKYGCAEVIDEFNGVVRDGKMQQALDQHPMDWLVMGASGLAAELRFLERTGQQHLEGDAWSGAQFDTNVINQYAHKAGHSVEEIRARADRLVVANWQHVMAMSRALTARRLLNYQAAKRASGTTEKLRPMPLPAQ